MFKEHFPEKVICVLKLKEGLEDKEREGKSVSKGHSQWKDPVSRVGMSEDSMFAQLNDDSCGHEHVE